MLLEKERKQIVEYGKKLIDSGLTRGTGGNISIFNFEKKLMAISPTGIEYFDTSPEDVVVMNLNGKIVEGSKKPSSEYRMHLIFYKNRNDVGAVVHTHSIYAATIASLRWELPPVHYMIAVAGNKVPCAEYASFGTEELATNAFKSVGETYNATLLANHGLIALGKNISEAFKVAEEIEFTAEVYYRAKAIGEPVILPEEEMKVMLNKFKTYGQQ
ncbi:L-fuculose-phosphate aldolase [Halothermothrix orenii]|uniref:Class II aldolase/adducin family protein n=1 Tax=Halothermothrix orenii (strain H 168 / OCM 544 / DSM 9562) TaxID=373903 RepID=B8CWP8_HALOH|nr:L-fuculose-phosphate aldolase [Halothermothrix orenii]ACL69717.1 class II aldolase/adducin family protein [Halothermothrix orenii H 168]